MSKSTSPAFPGFDKLSQNVWYNAPAAETSSSDISQPDLILLSTWMGASPRNIVKYIAGYRVLYPTSPIVVITNNLTDLLFRSKASQMASLSPVISVIETVKANSKTESRILLHTFSNGGSIQATFLAQAYAKAHNAPLPISGFILDSAPGGNGYWPAFKAFTAGAPKFFLGRWIAMLATHLLMIPWGILIFGLGIKTQIDYLRQDLNDPKLFPTSAPRRYVYSKGDELVPRRQVEFHAQDAKEKGFTVAALEFFGESRHVGHVLLYPNRYWAIADVTWRSDKWKRYQYVPDTVSRS